MSKQDALAVARKFMKLVGERYPVKRAYVFGSYAKGRADEASDIDVCVISPAFGRDYFKEEDELIKISLKLDERISPVAFSPEDFADKYSQLADEIAKHGIQI